MDHLILHCNRCLLHKTDAPDQGLVFYIANCRHVFCASCLQASQHQCFVCNDPRSQFIPIDDRMNGNTKLVMTNPGALLQAMEKSLAFQQMQTNFFNQAAEKKMAGMQSTLQSMGNEAMELYKMASDAKKEAEYVEAENSKMEIELNKLAREVAQMRSVLHSRRGESPSNFLQRTTPPTVRRLSSGSLTGMVNRSFEFLRNFGRARNTPPNVRTSRRIVEGCLSPNSSSGNMPNIFDQTNLFKLPKSPVANRTIRQRPF